VLLIMGMRDNACRERIAAALEAVAGVVDVDVNLHRARAAIVHEAHCAPAELVRSVIQAGYAVTLHATDCPRQTKDDRGHSRPPPA
jgi:cation transport ATPase